MQKFTAGALAFVAVVFAGSVGCSFVSMPAGEKHTGPVTVRDSDGRGFEFIRPNGEIFEMVFDPTYLGPKIKKDDVLGDVTYTDLKDHREFFVKAVLVKEAEVPTPVSKILTEPSSWNYVCNNGGVCGYSTQAGKSFYLWSDGGYRAKPEPKVKK